MAKNLIENSTNDLTFKGLNPDITGTTRKNQKVRKKKVLVQ
jgi:hypothetical protein